MFCAMHFAFCPTSQNPFWSSRSQHLHGPTIRSLTYAHPICAVKRRGSGSASTPKPKSKRAKRPRARPSSGFATSPSDEAPPQAEATNATESQNETATEAESGPDLQKRDAAGISLEDRLREEIAHPLRKPKLTLFATLAFSATLGLFFALARLARADDSPAQVAQNVAVDVLAIGLFGYLAWREVQFGRRSLNSLAGRPEARDLQVMVLGNGATKAAPVVGGSSGRRLGTLLKGNDVVVVAGRAADVRKYLIRVDGDKDAANGAVVVALPTDMRREEENAFEGATAVASGEAENAKDWSAWIGDAIPPKRNVALFRIEAGDNGRSAANVYVVAVGEPSSLPLPGSARRQTSDAG